MSESKEEDLLPYLTKVKEEDRLTWEEFGNEDWPQLEVICRDDWKLKQLQITKLKTIWINHPKLRGAFVLIFHVFCEL